VGSLALRPGDSLTIPKMALSVGFIRFVSSTDATQAKELLTLTPVGLTPTEHVSLCLDTLVRQNQIGVPRCLELKGVIGKMVESDRAFLLDFASKLAVRSIKSLGKP
jgi:hypothetical protein